MSSQALSKAAWLAEVNAEISRLCGLQMHDLPFTGYNVAYDQGQTAKAVAATAVREAEYYG